MRCCRDFVFIALNSDNTFDQEYALARPFPYIVPVCTVCSWSENAIYHHNYMPCWCSHMNICYNLVSKLPKKMHKNPFFEVLLPNLNHCNFPPPPYSYGNCRLYAAAAVAYFKKHRRYRFEKLTAWLNYSLILLRLIYQPGSCFNRCKTMTPSAVARVTIAQTAAFKGAVQPPSMLGNAVRRVASTPWVLRPS